MTSEAWQSVKSRFFEASAMESAQQRAFLRELEQADIEISEMVGTLLAQSSEESLYLRRPCWVAGSGTEQEIHALKVGQRLLDRFEIVDFLGSGGIGEVYRAFDHQQSVFVALKTLRLAVSWDTGATGNLRKELNAARSVTHPNVCRLYDLHWAAGSEAPPFLTMELLEGQTLAQYIRANGSLSLPMARPLADQMLDGLAAAHECGIVHRDFKAANVMLIDSLGRAIIMDFGLARDTNSAAEIQASLASNSLAGTPAYMAPEQLKGDRATFASDLHAAGVVLFEMVTGRRPFEGSSALEVASRRLNEEAPSPAQFAEHLDPRWEYAILKCLARDPLQRPQSVSDLRRLLDEPPPVLWLRRKIIVAAAAAGAVIATGVVGRLGLHTLAQFFSTPRPLLAAKDGTANTAAANGGLAMDYYLRGNSLLQEGSPESVRAAIERFERAVAENPKFAEGYAALAEAYLILRNFGYTNDVKLAQTAANYAERAVQLAPDLAEGHAALGAVRQLEWNWRASESSYDQALRLKPRFARARRWRAGLVLQFARFDEAISEMRTAFEQDPYDRNGVTGLGLALLFAGKYQEAISVLKQGIGERDMPMARSNLCQAYARLGSLLSGKAASDSFKLALFQAETVAAIERRTRVYESELSTRMFALVHSLRGNFHIARPFVQKLEAAVAAQKSSPGPLAMIYACQHKLNSALDQIERAITLHDGFVLYLRVHIFLEDLWGTPRFDACLRRLKLN
jgi:tetratricopeptide (TPR) repeat protein